MSRSRLLRSHSTDGFLHRTPSVYSSGHHDSFHSGGWDYPNAMYGSDYLPQCDDRYEQSSMWSEMQDTQSSKQHHVTWGNTPRYSADRDRLASRLESDRSGDRRYSGSYSPYQSSESCGSLYDYPRQGGSRSQYEGSAYGSQSYPLNYDLYRSRLSAQIGASDYYQRSSKPMIGSSFRKSGHFSSLPGRYSSSSSSYLRNPLLDLAYYPPVPFSRDQAMFRLGLQSSFQRPKRPKWRRSVIGLNRLSLYD